MDAMVCPKGHNSTEPDYCSECGAKIPAAASAVADSEANVEASAVPQTGACPSCGAPRDHSGTAFCEVCGRDFAAPPEAAGSSRSQPEQAGAPAATTVWSVTVSVDPALHEEGSPEPPAFTPAPVELNQPVSLIGRRSEVRAIFPEIDLSHDDAVSHRHALLQLYASGVLLLRDIGSSNGTRLNGKAIDRMIDLTMKNGDEITLGHWSKVTVKAGS